MNGTSRMSLFLTALLVVSAAGSVTGTSVSRTTELDSGSNAPLPGETVTVLNLSVSSDDVVVNDGDGVLDTSAGSTTLVFSTDARFVDTDSNGYDTGDEVYLDDDGDGFYTAGADSLVAGTAPAEGTSVSTENGSDADWSLDSIDDSDGDAWNAGTDFVGLDDDSDGSYTDQADTVLDGTAPANAAALSTTSDSDWRDGLSGTATAGDVEVVDAVDGDAWDPSADTIYIENGSTNGYQTAEDALLAGVEPSDGTSSTGAGGTDGDWTTVNLFDAVDGDAYDPAVDSIINDTHAGATYSAAADSAVAGTTPADGTSYTTLDGFDADWSLDSVDATDSDSWDSGADALVQDVGDRGTYSAGADTVVNTGTDGTVDVLDGAASSNNDLNESAYGAVDVDTSGDLSRGDEVYLEGDGGTAGSEDFGDDLTAVTIENTGNLTFDAGNVSDSALVVDGSQVATGTLSSGVLVFDLTGSPVDVSDATVTANLTLTMAASTGSTIDASVSPVADGGTAGAFDSGDRGLYLEQDAPVGGISNGAAITVDAPQAVSVEAISYADPSDGNRSKVELAFSEGINATSTATGDFTVTNENGSTNTVSAVEDDDGDGRLVLDIGATRSVDVASVSISSGALQRTNGFDVGAKNVSVQTTSSTVAEALGGVDQSDGDDIATYQGETIAVLADSENESIRVTEGGSAIVQGTTGTGSQVSVVDTSAESVGAVLQVLFDGDTTFDADASNDGATTMGDGDGTVTVQSLGLSVTSENDVKPGDSFDVTVEAASGSRATTLELQQDGSVLETIDTTLDGTGSKTATLSGQPAGTYVLVATDRDTGIQQTASVSISKPDTGGSGGGVVIADVDAPDSVVRDDPFTVSAVVENQGDSTTTETLSFRLDGTTLRQQTVTLDGGERTTVSMTGLSTEESSGTYSGTVSIEGYTTSLWLTVETASDQESSPTTTTPASDDNDAGQTGSTATTTVETTPSTVTTTSAGQSSDVEESTADATPGQPDTDGPNSTEATNAASDGSTPGFGAPAFLVALVAVSLLARRRSE
ncbi:PGF-CTERM sorting domain-containing protein [Haloarchaeobius sp. DFWS5]|uniref:PGF-CTERM sorting domain-containing protein n=1 Tax=Haloarchaeobius sp. DFWS5 TaxID=3446114 RepID=UPI003EBEC847